MKKKLSTTDTMVKNRVPHIILLYWVIKIISTTLGETGADMFSMTLNLGTVDSSIVICVILVFAIGRETMLERRRLC